MLNIKSLLTKILNTLTLRSGVTMTGPLKNSNGAVAVGSGQATNATIQDFVNEVRYSNGAVGSVYITSNYSQSGITIAAGWYNYCYIPHRYGGVNGAAPTTSNETDNCNYGNIILCGMTINNVYYNIRVSGGSIAAVYKYITASTAPAAITSGTTTNYNTYGNNVSLCNYTKLGRLVCVTLIVNCVSSAKWPSNYFASGLPAPYDSKEVYGSLGCVTDHSSMAVAINSSGQIKGSGGVNGKQYIGTVYYIASS